MAAPVITKYVEVSRKYWDLRLRYARPWFIIVPAREGETFRATKPRSEEPEDITIGFRGKDGDIEDALIPVHGRILKAEFFQSHKMIPNAAFALVVGDYDITEQLRTQCLIRLCEQAGLKDWIRGYYVLTVSPSI